MSVYIKGMEMPRNCWDCPFMNTEPCPCKGYSTALEHTTDRHQNCPIIPVPDHGDLIDRDKLMVGKLPNNRVYQCDERISYPPTVWQILDSITKAPTIIPEDKEAGE